MNIDCKNVTSLNNENSSMRNRYYDNSSLQEDFAEIRLIFSLLTYDEQQRFINYFRLLLAQEKASTPPASF